MFDFKTMEKTIAFMYTVKMPIFRTWPINLVYTSS